MSAEDEAVALEPQQPFLRVVRGDATPEEIAALVTVLAAARTAPPAPPRRRPEWGHARRAQRVTYRRGPGGWRASALPS